MRFREAPPHGIKRYRAKGFLCRCDICRVANIQTFRDERAERGRRIREAPSLRPHGDANTFNNWDCRCDECCDFMGRPRGTPTRTEMQAPPVVPQRTPRMQGRTPMQDPRRAAMLYVRPGVTVAEPFGREWLREAV